MADLKYFDKDGNPRTLVTPDFTIKDSGKRENLAGGMVRDTEEGKTDYSLIYDGPMLDRWAEHLTKGAKKYEPRNWMKAGDSRDFDDLMKTLDRFRRSFLRHQRKWLKGEMDEDHVAAMFFNLNGFEYIRGCLANLYKDAANDPRVEISQPRRPEDRAFVVHNHHKFGQHTHPVFDTIEQHEQAHINDYPQIPWARTPSTLEVP